MQEISSVCVEPCKGESIIVTVFEIFTSEVTSHPTQLLNLLFHTVNDLFELVPVDVFILSACNDSFREGKLELELESVEICVTMIFT